MQLVHTLQSSMPPCVVFRYLARFHRVMEWDPSVSRAKKITPGIIAAGTEFEVDVQFLGQATGLRYRIQSLEPNSLLILHGHANSYDVVDTITLTPTENGGTQLRYQLDVHYQPALKKMAGLFAPLVRRNVNAAILSLECTLNNVPQPVQTYPAWRDRCIVPGAFQFTRQGYRRNKKSWKGLIQNLQGKTILITGASSGLGRAATLALAEMGASIIAVVRDAGKGKTLQQDVRDFCNAEIRLEFAELSSLTQTTALAQKLLTEKLPLYAVVNNAGALFNQRTLTDEGLEKSFALLLASPFALTEMLLPLLQQSGAGRVVNVVSGGLYTQALNLDDLNFESEPYDGAKAYARAKRGLVDMTRWWAQHYGQRGVIFHAMHPGWADTQALVESLPGFHTAMQRFLRTPEQGADTIVWLSAADEPATCNGEFWLDRKIHTSAIFPGTESSTQTREQLQQSLHQLLQPFLSRQEASCLS